jgi:hypothetical protein
LEKGTNPSKLSGLSLKKRREKYTRISGCKGDLAKGRSST